MSATIEIGQLKWAGTDVYCRGCDRRLCGHDENWREHVVGRRQLASERLNSGDFGASYRVHEHDQVELAEFFCPDCRGLLSVELYTVGEPYRWTYRPLEVARDQGYDARADFTNDPTQWISFD